MWDSAYNNTKRISFINKYNIKCYVQICENCNKITKNKPTREMQIIGNCRQNIVECSCGLTFVEDLY